MEKRTILAIALSLLILMVWSAMLPKPQPIENKIVAEKSDLPLPSAPPKIEIPPSSLFNFSTDKLEIVFSESAAAIKEARFKDYKLARIPLGQGLFLRYPNLNFVRENPGDIHNVTFVHRDKDKQIVKRFNFSNSNYTIGLDIEVQNLSNVVLNFDLPLVLGILDFSVDPNEARFQDITALDQERAIHLNPRKDKVQENVRILGLRNKYFCAIIEPDKQNNNLYSAMVKKINAQESEVILSSPSMMLAPDQKIEKKFRIYLGPQELQMLRRINPEWSNIAHFGTFTFISQILLQLLNLLYSFAHNWGWAIIILSILVYLVLFPLTLKQMRSMKEMQALQPRIEELRKLYKNNPQKLNKEVMELYREHKVNPFGGCLPLVLQIPIFFALYQALMRFVAFKGAQFLWIKDLSEPDRLFILSFSLPMMGKEINILPIVMAIEMFVQQKISLTAGATSEAAQQQKMMTLVMPIIFGLIFYRMPSGLVLYWFVNSSLMLIYQFKITRK